MKARTITVVAMSGLFLFIDQWLKLQALFAWRQPHTLLRGYFGWEPFFNTGVAFSIPIPSYLTILFTVPIIIAMIFSLTRELEGTPASRRHHARIIQALAMIVAGALSNLIDRIRLGAVVDYLRIVTAVINIGDVLILSGFLLYLLTVRAQSVHSQKKTI